MLKPLLESVEGTPLAERLPTLAASFVERVSAPSSRAELPAPVLRGLARVLGSSPDTARYLALRPGLLLRLAGADRRALQRRARELPEAAPSPNGNDLEGFLDALRLFRRDETAFAACLDLGGLVPFEEISSFLSLVAEVVLDRALTAAQLRTRDGPEGGFSILGMGTLAGRELTCASDLDLIFLCETGEGTTEAAAKVAQRLISYLSTPTGAGVAYAVDARLRPSGGQGLLVSSFDAYERYQLERAQTWEHLALVRARAVAGDLARASPFLRRLQQAIRLRAISPWETIRDLRKRIASERAREHGGRVAFKTGSGGLMDVDFLAAGAQLERGGEGPVPELPSVPAMLEAAPPGPATEGLLEAYRFLRLLEARARWVAGRAVEALPAGETLAIVAELVEPGVSPAALLERTRAVRDRVREACERVLAAGTVRALESPAPR